MRMARTWHIVVMKITPGKGLFNLKQHRRFPMSAPPVSGSVGRQREFLKAAERGTRVVRSRLIRTHIVCPSRMYEFGIR